MANDPNGKGPASFSEAGARRVIASTRWVERNFRLPRSQRGRYPVAVGKTSMRIAKTGASGIPAMSGTSPNSGDVTLYSFDGTNLVAGDTVTAYTWNTKTAISASTWVLLTWIDGVWFVAAEDCS